MYRQSEKNLLSSNISSTCPHNMVNFGPLAAEIVSLVWGTPANFNGFRVLAALLRGTLVVGISQTLWRWTKGATYILQGGHHVGHWPTFLVFICSEVLTFCSFAFIVPRVSLLPPPLWSVCMWWHCLSDRLLQHCRRYGLLVLHRICTINIRQLPPKLLHVCICIYNKWSE